MKAILHNHSAQIHHDHSAIAGFPMRSLSSAMARILNGFATMARRADAERDLSLLNARMLDDVGITVSERNALLG